MSIAAITEKTRIEWPVVLTLVTCTAWISIELTALKTEVRHLASQTPSYHSRLTDVERALIERGAQIDAIIENLKR